MKNQKLENQLNLALSATEQERIKSSNLEIGYEPIEREWELIIKYSGEQFGIREIVTSMNVLLNNYAVITVKESRIEMLAALPEIIYIEKPKRLYFQVENGKRVSCINEVQDARISLLGQRTLIGIVDSGIDDRLEDFRNEDGKTRIRYLWDQALLPQGNEKSPEGYERGVEYTNEDIDQKLSRSRDVSGHGTAVAAIAAGSGTSQKGVAPESNLIIVKMGNASEEGFPRTTELMMGIDYVMRKAMELQMPVAINISFGNNYGAHDGSGLLEQFIEDISDNWKSVICIGTGNEGNGAGHTSGVLDESEEQRIEIAVTERSPSLNLQIWKAYFDEVDISIITPSGVMVGPIREELGTQRVMIGATQLLIYYGEPSPFSIDQEIYMEFLPEETYISSGIWTVVLTPRRIVNGAFSMWLPSENTLNVGTGFLDPISERTLTIPSTSYGTIGVGAYDAKTLTYADFSGRGPAGPGRRGKPDLVAPGVEIRVPVPGGTFAEVSGTSFATPFVTGAAALLMEWGIVRGNDPFLYGEKVKAYFQRGAKELPGITDYPDTKVGYGALCLENSIPF